MFVTANSAEMGATAGALGAVTAAFAGANAAASAPTTAVAPAQANETALLLSSAFGAQGALYQSLAAMAATWQGMFSETLAVSGASYAVTEAANTAAAL